jgi:hypothetical protein
MVRRRRRDWSVSRGLIGRARAVGGDFGKSLGHHLDDQIPLPPDERFARPLERATSTVGIPLAIRASSARLSLFPTRPEETGTGKPTYF